ncbi:LamG-like jellyroll fold domain-containing protein [Candidatus Poribacteria bacterium]
MRIVLINIVLITVGILMAGSIFAAIDPETVADGHVWLFDEGVGNTVEDSSKNNLNGTVKGNPGVVKGIIGDALEFDGASDYITLPDSANINTGGPWTNRTIKVIFNCADVSINSNKQTLFEEGGRTRGLVVYVFDGEVYVGGWNRSEYNWNGAWLSAPIKSDNWYEVALILRDTQGKVEDDKLEMWLDGKLIGKEAGGQMHAHADDNGIGAVNQNTVFHDEGGSGTMTDYFGGMIDEIWVLNQALTAAELGPPLISVEPVDRLTATWGSIKAEGE